MSIFSFLVMIGFLCADESPLKKAVIAADKNLNELIVEHRVVAGADVYADDFVLTTSSGKRKTKQDILNEVGFEDLSFEINETTEVQVMILRETAVLTGILHQKGTYKQKSFDNKLYVTDTWVLVEGNWKLLAGHASLITQP